MNEPLYGIHMKYLFNRQLNVKDNNWVHDEMQQNIVTNQETQSLKKKD